MRVQKCVFSPETESLLFNDTHDSSDTKNFGGLLVVNIAACENVGVDFASNLLTALRDLRGTWCAASVEAIAVVPALLCEEAPCHWATWTW